MFLFLLFLKISFEKIRYKIIFRIPKIKLGILAEISLTQKKEKLILWKIVNMYWEKSYFHDNNTGAKSFKLAKYEIIELYHSSIQNDQVHNS